MNNLSEMPIEEILVEVIRTIARLFDGNIMWPSEAMMEEKSLKLEWK